MCFVNALESFTRNRSIPRYFNKDNESDSVCGSLDAARRGARGHLSTADSGHCTDAQRQSRFRPDARKGALIA
jgi:hypothetical protein